MQQLKLWAMLFVVALGVASCVDDETPKLQPSATTDAREGAFILNQGNQAAKIDGSYSVFNWGDNPVNNSVFSTANGRSLGEGPQDGVVYGSKLYVSLFGSNVVQVIDAQTHRLIRSISTRQPQGLAAYGGHIYVANNTGRVTKIDTLDLQQKAQIEVGPNPVDLTVRNGMLYASISDGYNYQNGYINGKRLAKIDLAQFRKVGDVMLHATTTDANQPAATATQPIEGVNPTQLTQDEDGNIFVVCMGDYNRLLPKVWKVDANDHAQPFADGNIAAAHHHLLYVINSTTNWQTGAVQVKWSVYDSRDSRVLSDKFAADHLPLDPIALAVHPRTGYLFVTSRGVVDVKTKYTSPGRLYSYTTQGNLLGNWTVGIEPYAVVFR